MEMNIKETTSDSQAPVNVMVDLDTTSGTRNDDTKSSCVQHDNDIERGDANHIFGKRHQIDEAIDVLEKSACLSVEESDYDFYPYDLDDDFTRHSQNKNGGNFHENDDNNLLKNDTKIRILDDSSARCGWNDRYCTDDDDDDNASGTDDIDHVSTNTIEQVRKSTQVR